MKKDSPEMASARLTAQAISDLKFRAIFENSGIAIVVIDKDGICHLANSLAAKNMGLQADEINGRSMFEFLPRETAQKYLERNRQTIESGIDKEYEDTFQLPTGPRTFLVADQVLKDRQGRGYALLSSSIDITERKQAEEALRESENNYRLLARNLPDTSVLLFDHDLRFILAEGALHPEFDYASNQLEGKTLWDILPKERAEILAPLYKNALKGISTENYISDYKDHCFSTNILPIRNNKGEIISGMIVSQDITKRKRAEEALQESERTVRNKLDAVLSPEGDISTLNLADIIDSQSIQAIMDDFFNITHIGVGLIDLNGKVLVANGWQDVCTKFHRVNPETCRNCIESDTILSLGGLLGKSKAYKCENNMWDISTPIIVGGKHLGNIFLGQFFYEDETPDIEAFRAQARRFGFNEDEYMDALDRVPRWSRETVECVMRFYSRLSLFISNLSYGNLKLAQTLDERNKAVEALQTNYSLLRIAGKTAKFGGWSLILADNKVIWSDEVAAIHEMPTGYSPSLDEGIKFYAPEWRDKIAQLVNNCIEKEIPFDDELELITAQDKRIWVRATGEAVRNENGEVYKLQGSFQNINEQKQVEKALRESEEKYRTLLEFAPDAFLQGDSNGNFITVNNKVIELTGYSREELFTMNISELFPADVLIDNPLRYDQLKHVGTITAERELMKKSGERILIEMNSKAMTDGTFQCFLRDITDRKQAEQALKQSEASLRELNATKDKFFSIIAHDLRSPFNSIIGLSNLLVEQIQEKDYVGIEKYADIIQNSSQQAMDLLMNLMEWSRSQTGRMEFFPEYVEMGALINEVTKLFNDSAQQKSITISKKSPRNVLAFVDKAMINTILRNLISNAIKFTNPGGKIVISMQQKLDETVVAVCDNGIGIKKGTIGKMFRIEESLSKLGTQNEKGTGLGLLLCKEFVEKHGGKIWVESEPGKGSTFYFSIPGIKNSSQI